MRRIMIFALLFLLNTLVYAEFDNKNKDNNKDNNEQVFVFSNATIETLQLAIKNRQITCEYFINSYLVAHPKINPSAITQAQKVDDKFSKTHSLIGPLHCVPVIIKHNIQTVLFMLPGSQSVGDAWLISQLRKAGAIILGK